MKLTLAAAVIALPIFFTVPASADAAGGITGRITHASDGTPVTDADIDFSIANDWVTRVKTDGNGVYMVLDLPDGDYELQTSSPGENLVSYFWPGTPYWDERTSVTVSGGLVTGIDFALLAGGRVAGSVRGQPGFPVDGQQVVLPDPSWRWAGYGTVQSDGMYEILGVPAGDYSAYIGVPGYVYQSWDHVGPGETETRIPITAGSEVTGIDFDLIPEGIVTGVLLDDVTGLGIQGTIEMRSFDEVVGASVDTDVDGTFRATGLPAATYRLSAHAPNHVERQFRDADGNWIPFVVEEGQTLSGAELRLDQAAAIEGTIYDAEGAPIKGAYVEADFAADGPAHGATADDDGHFRIDGLISGDWLVWAVGEDSVGLFYGGGGDRSGATPIRATVPETVAGIDITLPAAGHVTGRVTRESDGTGLEGVEIEAFFGGDRSVLGSWTLTTSDGSYDLGSVPPNQPVLIRAQDWQNRFGSLWWPGVALPLDATPVLVAAGESRDGIDFALGEPGVLELSASSFVFSGGTFDGEIPEQILEITNLGPGAVALGIWGDADWLSTGCDVSTPVLTAGQGVTVHVAAYAFGLTAGVHTGQIHIWDAVSDRETKLDVTLTLTESPASLEVSHDEIDVTMEEGLGDGEAQFSLANIGGGAISWTASSDSSAVFLEPSSGTLERGGQSAVVTLRVASSGLSAGDYLSSIRIEYGGAGMRPTASANVPVSTSVTPSSNGNPLVQVPSIVHVYIPSGRNGRPEKPTVTTAFDISNGGTGTLHWRSNALAEWIRVEPESGEVGAGETMSVKLTIDTVDLDNGGNSAVLEVANGREARAISIEADLGSTSSAGPVTPTAAGELVVPVLVHAEGNAGSQFVSDLWISYLPTGRDVDATLSFVPRGGDGSVNAITTPVRFESGQTISLLDVVGNWLQGAIPAGSLVLRSNDIGAFEMVSRTYNDAENGTFGQEIPAIPSSGGASALGGALFATGLRKSADFRTNLLLTEVAGSRATARIRLFTPAGTLLGQRDVDVAPFTTVQVNDVIGAVGGSAGDGVLAEVSVTAGGGKVAALASVVDNHTNDPTTLLAQPRRPEEATLVVPVVAHALGLGGTSWVTDVAIANADRTARSVTITYYDRSGRQDGSLAKEIAPGETLALDDVVLAQFGKPAGRGQLRIESVPAGGLVAMSRIYNDAAAGTFGQGVPALPRGEAIAAGSGFHHLIGLSNGETFRTNVGITEVTGAPARVAVALVDRRSDRIVGYREIELAANAQYQDNVFALFGYGDVEVRNASVFIRVVGGTGRVLAYASMVDNRTGDGTTLLPPARMLPTER